MERVQNVNDVLKTIFAPIFEAALKGELQNHLGYKEHERCGKTSQNSRNGYSGKTIKTSLGETPMVPLLYNVSYERILDPDSINTV